MRYIQWLLRALAPEWWAWTLAAVVLGGCTRNAQVVAANTMVATVDSAWPVLLSLYRGDGDRCLDEATYDSAKVCATAVDAKWEPTWHAIDAFESAHGAWATAYEQGTVDTAALLSAYCSARAFLVGKVSLPDVGCP